MNRDHFKPWARAGYTSRGVVYLIVGFFALLAAIGAGRTTGTEGALVSLLSQPFGKVLVGAMIVGLIGYVIWRLIQAIFDTDDHGVSVKGLGVRAGLLASAFTYTTLAIYASSLLGLFGGFGGDGGQGSIAKQISGFVGSRPVALGLAVIFVIVGAAHCWKAVTVKFADHFTPDAPMGVLTPISMAGLIARGIVFFILAFLLAYRGLSAGGRSERPGIEDAFNFLLELPYGTGLLAVMGNGIILFAVYSFSEAVWRKINIHDAR